MITSDSLLHDYRASDKHGERTRLDSTYNPMYSFRLPRGENRHYAQQFADMYFLRLHKLKPIVEAIAVREWEDFEIAGERAKQVARVLDVRQGELSWVVGTTYIDLPLKPNVLEDVSRDHFIAGPPPRTSYYTTDGEPDIMLEDESGRLRLVGAMLKQNVMVTGVILAVLGTENANGDFEVLDIHIPDLAEQPARWKRDDEEFEQEGDKRKKMVRSTKQGKKIALVSGLEISGTAADNLTLSLLSEYLLGEALDDEDQDNVTNVSRLMIVGNSIASDVISDIPTEEARKPNLKKYGYDSSTYNPAPTLTLDNFISELLPTIPVTIMSGEFDPTTYGLPQQPIHSAMFPHSRTYACSNISAPEADEPGWFDSVTNPWDGDIEGWRFLGNSGQPVDDILKYVDLGGPDGKDAEGRLEVMESMLRWRNSAPTAPDTLWSYPFQERDPFVMSKCPHVFFVGNQPRFDTTIVQGDQGQSVRLITIPRFRETGQLVLLDTESLEPELVQFDIIGLDERLPMTVNGNGSQHAPDVGMGDE